MDAFLAQAWLELADGRMHWLDKTPCTIGRGATSTLVLAVPGLSRSHAVIQPGPGGGYLLADLRSTNGTYVNGLRLDQVVALRNGDRIELGEAAFTYRCQQTLTPAADFDPTAVQVYSGTCWLLLLDLIGHTARTHEVGAEAATADFKRWLELLRPVLLHAGGTINAYLGDAVFVYWRQDRHPAEKILATVHELVRLQTVSPRPYRVILHCAETRISGGLQSESLSGSDVIFLFRIEKSTKDLGSACVLTEAAVKSLQLAVTARPLGRHPVRGYPGEHAFFTLPAR